MKKTKTGGGPGAAALARWREAVRTRLLPWFLRHARPMPWRQNRTPYRVLVSELMLQQTRVDQVRPYYARFMRRFPSLRALAAAEMSEVLKLWEGLGYYARARNLHRLARVVVREHGGRIPATQDGLRGLPGIGPYTAGAVGSLALGLDLAVVDGNVERVFGRLAARRSATRAQVQAMADALLVPGHAADYNESLMELGATVCRPRAPLCGECPLGGVCRGRASGRPDSFPAPRPRKKLPHVIVGAAVVANRRGEVLIAQRKEDAMLGGLWEFPGGKREEGETFEQCVERELMEEMGIAIEAGEHLVTVRHAYSHFTISLHAYRARLLRGRPQRIHCADFAWVPVSRLRDRPFSRADLHIIDALEIAAGPGRAGPAPASRRSPKP